MADLQAAPSRRSGRAGRDLSAAVLVGVGLAALAVVSLFTVKTLFLGVLAAAVLVALWELTRAVRRKRVVVPFPPLAVGGVATIVLAYLRGAEAMMVAAMLTAIALVVWRLAESPQGVIGDVAAGLFGLVYVVGLASFAALLLVPGDGARRVFTFIAVVVFSDVGGYVAGVLVGRHPMAPRISPRKSWEGFVGSLATCAGVGAVLLSGLFAVAPWKGVLLGLALACSATLGDLGESVIKRDLGVKDMGALLPGHGGLMDRMDSLLASAPVAWLLLSAFLRQVH